MDNCENSIQSCFLFDSTINGTRMYWVVIPRKCASLVSACLFFSYHLLGLRFRGLITHIRSICLKFLLSALFNDIPVGNICCRFENDGKDSVKLYIMTLGCLAPYRRLGIASKVSVTICYDVFSLDAFFAKADDKYFFLFLPSSFSRIL